jgi:cellulose synthase/poly-beta-1,6-N-acetylglucosamine synthase-like glycosyltransferase
MFDVALDYLLNQSFGSMLATFWFPLFVELPRFFLGGVVAGWFILFHGSRAGYPDRASGGITVVIPGHNDSKAMRRTVLSLREQTVDLLQIIAVNDGSTDDTDAVCRSLERNGLIDNYIHIRSRSGKAAVVNAALEIARHDLFLVTDSDTTFDRDALAIAASYFSDPRVGAVGGTLRVRNIDRTVATRVQHINYAFSITLGRIVKDMLGFYFVASGAFGLYRTAAVRSIGCWDFGPGEDGDIITRLRMAGWCARFAPFAVAMTEVPTTFVKLSRQRLRWDRSMIRNRLRKAGPYVTNPRNANFDLPFAISFLDIYFFTGLVPFLFIVYAVQLVGIYGEFAIGLLLAVQFFYMAAALAKYLIALSVSTRRAEDVSYILYVPLFSLVNVYLLRYVRLYAIVNELIVRGSYTDPYVPAKVRARVERF